MGDRTWYMIRFRDTDRKKVHAILDFEKEEEDRGIVTGELGEMNYGGFSSNEELMEDGVVFAGSHGGGGSYGPHEFAYNGEDYGGVECNHNGDPVVPVINGKIDDDRLNAVLEFELVRALVKDIFQEHIEAWEVMNSVIN